MTRRPPAIGFYGIANQALGGLALIVVGGELALLASGSQLVGEFGHMAEMSAVDVFDTLVDLVLAGTSVVIGNALLLGRTWSRKASLVLVWVKIFLWLAKHALVRYRLGIDPTLEAEPQVAGVFAFVYTAALFVALGWHGLQVHFLTRPEVVDAVDSGAARVGAREDL